MSKRKQGKGKSKAKGGSSVKAAPSPNESGLSDVRPEPGETLGDQASDRARIGWFVAVVAAASAASFEVLAAGLRVITHSDLWWAMAAGRHITETGSVPKEDVFSYTFLGRHWINMEWLTQVLYYNAYHHVGEIGVTLLRVGLCFVIFSLCFTLAFLRSRNLFLSFAAVALGAWVCVPFLDARPQLFTFLYTIVFLLLLDRFRRVGQARALFFLPLVMVLWVNQHYGFIFGVLILIGNIGAESIKRLVQDVLEKKGKPGFAPALTWRHIAYLGGATGATILATLLNPWGLEGLIHPLEMSSVVSGESPFLTILEWTPPVFSGTFSPPQFWLLLAVAGLAGLVALFLRPREFDLNDVGLSAVVAVFFALQHRRFIPLFAVVSVPLVAYTVQLILVGVGERRQRARASSRAKKKGEVWEPMPVAGAFVGRIPLVLGALFFLGAMVHAGVRTYMFQEKYAKTNEGKTVFQTNIHYDYYPTKAIEFIRETGLKGPMYNLYNWGGYLMFFLPDEKVFVDGRAQTVYDERFYMTNQLVHNGSGQWPKIFDEYDIKFALISRAGANTQLRMQLLRSKKWKWVFADGFAAIFVRVCPENQEILTRFRKRTLPLPETAMTSYLYAKQASADRDWNQAVKDYAEACLRAPEQQEYRSGLITALIQAKRYKEARTAVEEGIARNPESSILQIELARVEGLVGNVEKGFDIAKTVFEKEPDQLLAVEIMIMCDPQRGARVVEKAYESDEDDPKLILAQGLVSFLFKQYPVAERQVIRAIQSHDKKDRIFTAKGMDLLRRIRDRGKAAEGAAAPGLPGTISPPGMGRGPGAG